MFEHIEMVDNNNSTTPKPIRSITPPRDDIDNNEIENEPMQRQVDVVSSTESGLARSRKEMFQQVTATTPVGEKTRVKSITPPREDKRQKRRKDTRT